MAVTLPLGGTIPTPFDPASEDDYAADINSSIVAAQGETITKTVAQDFADQELSRPELKDYSETLQTLSISTGAATWDVTAGNHAQITLTEDVTLTISNPPATGKLGGLFLFVTQAATGSRTLTFPASVQDAPTVTTAAGKTDIYVLVTRDGGTKYFVNPFQVGVAG